MRQPWARVFVELAKLHSRLSYARLQARMLCTHCRPGFMACHTCLFTPVAGLEAVDHAAEAVLPLALSDPPALQRSGEALLAACADGAAKVSSRGVGLLQARSSQCLDGGADREQWHAVRLPSFHVPPTACQPLPV